MDIDQIFNQKQEVAGEDYTIASLSLKLKISPRQLRRLANLFDGAGACWRGGQWVFDQLGVQKILARRKRGRPAKNEQNYLKIYTDYTVTDKDDNIITISSDRDYPTMLFDELKKLKKNEVIINE